jgi:hypothetical protein
MITTDPGNQIKYIWILCDLLRKQLLKWDFFFLNCKILLIGTTIHKKYKVGIEYKTSSIHQTNRKERPYKQGETKLEKQQKNAANTVSKCQDCIRKT